MIKNYLIILILLFCNSSAFANEKLNYNIIIEPGQGRAGRISDVKVLLKTKNDFKINDLFPVSLNLTHNESNGIILLNSKLTKKNAKFSKDKKRLWFYVPFVGQKEGTHYILGTFKFSICNKTTCYIYKNKIIINVIIIE